MTDLYSSPKKYKCLFCNNCFCEDHFHKHVAYHKGKENQLVGATITEKDSYYKDVPCFVCNTIKEIQDFNNKRIEIKNE